MALPRPVMRGRGSARAVGQPSQSDQVALTVVSICG